MPEEDQIRISLMDLLRYANATAVGAALGVSAQSVKNWANGRHPSQRRLDQVRTLYGLPTGPQDTTKEPLEPPWLEGLASEIAGKVIAELTTSRQEEMRRLIDDLEQRLAQRSEAPPVRTDTEDRGG